MSKVVAACVYALLLQLANEPSPPRASLIPFSCFIKTKLRVMLSWQIKCYLVIGIQLNLFCNALNFLVHFIFNHNGPGGKNLILPSWSQFLKSIGICVSASCSLLPERTDLVLFFESTQRDYNFGMDHNMYYWGGFSRCFLDCVKLDIGHGLFSAVD